MVYRYPTDLELSELPYKRKFVTANIPQFFTDINGNICKYDHTTEEHDVIHYYVKNNETVYFVFNFNLVGNPKTFINTNGELCSYVYSNDHGDWYTYKGFMNQQSGRETLLILHNPDEKI